MRFKLGIVPLLATGLLAASAAIAQVVSGPAVNVTPTQARNNTRPHVSLSGNKIAYTYTGWWSKNDAWVMDTDGANKQQVWYDLGEGNHIDLRADEWPSLNADGTKVLFHSWTQDSAHTDIYLQDLGTGVTTQLTTATTNEAWPHFSPDGSKIVFLSNRVGAAYQVHMMDAAPESATNVPKILSNFQSVTYARFAPDGQHLLMSAIDASHADERAIYRMDVADSNGNGVGDNLVRLTNQPGMVAEQPSQPSVGSRIFFVANFSPDGLLRVYSMAPDGSDIRQVTGADREDRFMYAAADKMVVSYNNGAGGYTREQGFNNADLDLFTLVEGTASGTLNGRVCMAPEKGVGGVEVSIFNGSTLVKSVNTDSQGRFTTTLAPGGYLLRLDAFGVIDDNTYRGVVVAPGATVARDFYVSSPDSTAPSGLIPTVSGNSVDVRWSAPTLAWEVKGYNVYRALTENGPWTKANAAIVPSSGTPSFVDTAPGDLYSAFYTVTTVATDGFTDWESGPSDVVQAANNLIFNPSFEIVDANGDPIGWNKVQWGGTIVPRSTTTDEKATGNRSAYIGAGPTADWTFWDTNTVYSPPSTPGDRIVFGMYGRFRESPLPGGIVGLTAFASGDGGVAEEFYDWDWHGTIAMNGQSDPNQPWKWLFNQSTLSLWEEMKYTRYSAAWGGSGGTGITPGVSRAFYDEVRWQLRRVGATGVVVGRILAQDGSPMTGVSVSLGDRTAVSGNGGLFIFRGVPTGPVSLAAGVSGFSTTAEVRNIGGARVDMVMPPMPPLTITGTVKMADGTPVPNAPVRLVYGVGEDPNQITQTTTTNSEGIYSFPDPPKGTGATAIVSSVPGYRARRVGGSYGAYGELVKDIAIDTPAPLVQVPLAAAAPTVDGVVNAAEWAAATQIPMNTGLVTPGTETMAYAMWLGQSIHLAFVGGEPNTAGISARASARDTQPLWYYADIESWNADDVFEVELDPTNGGEAGYGYERWQTMFNANTNGLGMADIAWRSAVPSLWGGDETIDGYTFKTKMDSVAKTWSAEVTIPVADLNVANGLSNLTLANGTKWLMLLHRHRNQDLPNGQDLWPNDSGWLTMHFVTAITAMKGDLNGDLAVTQADAQIALRIAAGLEAAGSRNAQGDVVGDDQTITLLDAARIARKANGLEPGFPQ